jgi:prephenate dehydratase
MDNLIRTADESVVISRELILPISNCLISKAKEISQIKTIVSHPQAIAQCHGFISKFFHDDVKIINSSSTSDAVKSLIEQDETFAAIANAKARNIIPSCFREIHQ